LPFSSSPILFLADVLDRDHVLILGGIEHDDPLRRPPRDADAFDRAADQLALVGDQHDLIGILTGNDATSLPLRPFTDIRAIYNSAKAATKQPRTMPGLIMCAEGKLGQYLATSGPPKR
jgi:hypothetical protein